MIDYIVQVVFYQAIFLIVYVFLFKKETFYQWNRSFLLVSSLVSYFLPFIDLTILFNEIPQEFIINLPEISLGSVEVTRQKTIVDSVSQFNSFGLVYLLGIAITMIIFVFKLSKIATMYYGNERVKRGGCTIIFVKNSNLGFSFFNWVFIGDHLENFDLVLNHERIHVKQWHSLDLMFFEIQKIIFWFNPLSYLFQVKISVLHEYIADSKILVNFNKKEYFEFVLDQMVNSSYSSMTSSFNKISILKKRIIMTHKNNSKDIFRIKYLICLPLITVMILIASCVKEEKSLEASLKNPKRPINSIIQNTKTGEKKELSSEKMGYFDLMLLNNDEEFEGREVSVDELSEDEREEYDQLAISFSSFNLTDNFSFKVMEGNDGIKSFHVNRIENNNDIKMVDYSDQDEVSFKDLDIQPKFKDCEITENHKDCFVDPLSKHVAEHFNPKVAQNIGLEKGTKRVYVQFMINKEGNVEDINVRGPHEAIEDEALRVMALLPTVVPGQYGGKNVNVKYTLPINFDVD